MTAKEYLSQAYQIDKRIRLKLEQVASLGDLSTRATSALTGMPRPATRNVHRMEDVIVKMADLEDEIQGDIDRLVDLKREINECIASVSNERCRFLLESRYLSFRQWPDIADDMDCSMDNIFKLHKKALEEVEGIKRLQ